MFFGALRYFVSHYVHHGTMIRTSTESRKARYITDQLLCMRMKAVALRLLPMLLGKLHESAFFMLQVCFYRIWVATVKFSVCTMPRGDTKFCSGHLFVHKQHFEVKSGANFALSLVEKLGGEIFLPSK